MFFFWLIRSLRFDRMYFCIHDSILMMMMTILYFRPEFIEFFGLNSSLNTAPESDNGKANDTVAKGKANETEVPSSPVITHFRKETRLICNSTSFFLVGRSSC